MQWIALVSLGLGGIAVLGCQQPVPPTEPAQQSFCVVDDSEFDLLWETCLTVLRRNRFKPDRVDREAGVITTFPVTSQQFFEFWRRDVDTGVDLFEASIHTMRRRATINVERGQDDAMRCDVVVRVDHARLSAPERQFNNSVMALRYFGDDLPGEAGDRRLIRRHDTWQARGRDGAMEQYLLNKIRDEGVLPESCPSAEDLEPGPEAQDAEPPPEE
jgi:hypothetical protein